MKRKLTISSLLLVALFLTLAPTILASTIWYVNGVTGNDSNNCQSPTTACKTIGHAISLASSSDSISVAAATYTENLTIGSSLNLIGSGSNTTIIDGGGINSVLRITKSSAQVTLSSVTIRHGLARYGAGIYNPGTLTIIASTISSNTYGYKFSGCASGAGIYNNSSGVLTINNSTISGNSVWCYRRLIPCATYGGGIYNDGKVLINNSTIVGNSASASFASSQGGGIYNFGVLSISNSTLNENRASIGGGIYGGGWLQNSIVAGNYGGNCSRSINSYGYNMSSDGSCNFSNSGDRNNIDPMLGTLGSYGGPTQTIPLLTGSPAIDAGNPSGCKDTQGHLLKTDQRGMPRPDKEDTLGCDMGAYEKQSD